MNSSIGEKIVITFFIFVKYKRQVKNDFTFFLYFINDRTEGGVLDSILSFTELLNRGGGREYKKSSDLSLSLEICKGCHPEKEVIESVVGLGVELRPSDSSSHS